MAVLPPSLSRRLAGATASYRSVLALPGAVRFFVPSVVARFGVAMTGLGVLLAVESLTGSFAVGGLVTGGFAIAEALVGPQVARLIDAHGQGRVLPRIVTAHLGAMILLLVVAATHAPVAVVIGVAAVAGATIPQPGALSAARWSALAPTPDAVRAAFSLEGIVNDLAFLTAPIVVTVLSVNVLPLAGVILSSTCVVVGCLVLAAQRDSEPIPATARIPDAAPVPAAAPVSATAHTRRERRTRASERLFTSRFAGLLAVNLSLGFFFGSVQIAVTALAFESGIASFTGLLLATTSVASLVGGLVYGSRSWSASPERILVIVAVFLAALTALAALSPSVPLTFVAVGLAGAAITPIIATTNLLIQRSVPHAVLTQSFTWINSSSAAGIACAAALVGAAVQQGGPESGFTVAALLVAATPIAALVAARRSVVAARSS